MAAKEWLVPLLLAGATFAGLALLPQPHSGSAEPGPRLTHPFPDIASAGPTPDGFQALALLRPALAEGESCPTAFGSGTKGGLTLDGLHVQATCVGTGLATLDLPGWTAVALSDRPAAGHVLEVRQAPPGPRLGVAGYNGTRVTVHVFDADGELVASNGDASEQARLRGQFAAEQLPAGVWYLGANATPPNGTKALPLYARAFLGQMRPLLEGLPVGGVATTQTDALSGLYGRLYVTAQVEELVYAP